MLDNRTVDELDTKDGANTSPVHVTLLDDEAVASRATQIVQVFSEENMCLRRQLEKYYKEIRHLKSVSSKLLFGHMVRIR